MTRPDVSVVLGSFNRKRLLALTIQSVRTNGFRGQIEIIVVDGGSQDGTCEWLARQKDVLTIIQPNYSVKQIDGTLRRAHTWGEFINLGFRVAAAPWVVMVSDDLILCPSALQSGYDELNRRTAQGQQIGGGAIFWREYPRTAMYHVKLLPGGFVHINHGFFNKVALESVGYADENSFEFYGSDSDLTMRLNLSGWSTVILNQSYAEHLNHKVSIKRWLKRETYTSDLDMAAFYTRYRHLDYVQRRIVKNWHDPVRTARRFWSADPIACIQGLLLRLITNSRRQAQ